MLCDDCQKKQASVNYTQIINNKKNIMNLCRDCAEKRGFTGHVPGPTQNIGVGNLISKIASDSEEEKDAVRCKRCGLRYSDFRQSGRLGCGHCYAAFSNRLDDLLRKVHGSDTHIGRVPQNLEPEIRQSREVEALRKELREAIQKEDFEKAAGLRDRLHKMEGDAHV